MICALMIIRSACGMSTQKVIQVAGIDPSYWSKDQWSNSNRFLRTKFYLESIKITNNMLQRGEQLFAISGNTSDIIKISYQHGIVTWSLLV